MLANMPLTVAHEVETIKRSPVRTKIPQRRMASSWALKQRQDQDAFSFVDRRTNKTKELHSIKKNP